ncbi:hypothetical protein HS7_18280 [Sulfolobales archaeon HS-7]|nr:hypothetical protein HS7_18280 [Sulfolobales archaeon HS-7]
MIPKDKGLERGLEVVKKAEIEGIQLRLIGGIAVAYLAKIGSEVYSREYKDVDYYTISKYRGKLDKFFEKNGFEPNSRFNALHGFSRLIYRDLLLDTDTDVFLDDFKMCHVIRLGERILSFSPTIPPSDLLLTKMQVVKLTENDIKDIAALLTDLTFGDSDTNKTIDLRRVLSVLSDDWGFYKTFTINLKRVGEYVKDRTVRDKLDFLYQAIEKSPKSMKWKMRSKIGEKVKWYDEPEDV